MGSVNRKNLLTIFKLLDIVILLVSFYIASWLTTIPKTSLNLGDFFSLRISMVNLIGIVCLSLIWHIIFHNFHLYHSRRLSTQIEEWKDVIKATTLGSAAFMFAGLLFKIIAFTPLFIVVFWFASTSITIIFRIILRSLLRRLRVRGRNLRFALIVGTNIKSYKFAEMLKQKKELGYRLLGFIDSQVYLKRDGIKLLGSFEDFPHILKTTVVDEVIITLPIKSHYDVINRIVEKAEEHGIIIRYLSQLFETKIARSDMERFDEYAVLTIASGPQEGWPYATKRAVDILFASVLLVLFLPVMLFTFFAIKFSSRGPVFFVQERVGYNKRIFRLYKFRTMRVDAERIQAKFEHMNEMDGPVFKIKDDPRITRLGRILRKLSIDELPQLINVMKGDMSLVGPRPLPIRDFNGFRQDWQLRRCSVLPGITCTWQISGRNNVSFDDWMKLDMDYIDNWTLQNDFKILLKTIPAVLSKKGAA